MSKIFLGKGAYGLVYSLKGEAIKKVKNDTKSIDTELIFMKSLCHERINQSNQIVFGTKFSYIHQTQALTDLHTYSRQFFLPKETRESWTEQILQGLVFMHKRNIVHCDIKSSNILVYNNNNVKITDFSLTRYKVFKEIDYPEFIMGTLDDEICTTTHRPPEVWYNLEWNNRVDIWGLGCVLYEMLNKKNLFSDLESIFKPWSTDNLMVLKCLELNPKKRPSSFELLGMPEIYPEDNLVEDIRKSISSDIVSEKLSLILKNCDVDISKKERKLIKDNLVINFSVKDREVVELEESSIES